MNVRFKPRRVVNNGHVQELTRLRLRSPKDWRQFSEAKSKGKFDDVKDNGDMVSTPFMLVLAVWAGIAPWSAHGKFGCRRMTWMEWMGIRRTG